MSLCREAEEWSKVSDEAKNLIKKMLTKDPAQRISAEEAYNDPWIQKNASSQPLNSKALDKLGKFHGKNKMKAAIMQFIATQVMTNQEKEELQKAFKSIDKNGDGILSKDELYDGKRGEALGRRIHAGDERRAEGARAGGRDLRGGGLEQVRQGGPHR